MRVIQGFVRRIGEGIAGFLFDRYLRNMVDEYVRRERDRWAEAVQIAERRREQAEKHLEYMRAMQWDLLTKAPNAPWVGVQMQNIKVPE